jgi:type VI protein secretion system component VasF
MTHELLDLERIRRNWSRGDVAQLEPVPDRLGQVTAPIDVYRVGAQLLERLRREVADQFPEQRARLAPFLARTEATFARMRESVAAGQDALALRQEFVSTLQDIEDLCEALLSVRP